MNLLNNLLVRWVIAMLIVFGLLYMTGMTFSFSVGAGGIHGSVERQETL